MTKYAQNTIVATEQSRIGIERTLKKYGADQFAYASMDDKAMIAFRMQGKQVKMIIPLPAVEDYKYTPEKRIVRSVKSQQEAWEQDCRQKWRVVNIMITAKFAAIEAGVRTFEEEFMSDTVMPNGQTVGNFMLPQIEAAYQRGAPPKLFIES